MYVYPGYTPNHYHTLTEALLFDRGDWEYVFKQSSFPSGVQQIQLIYLDFP